MSGQDPLTPEELRAIREMHEQQLADARRRAEMPTVSDAAMALGISEEEVQSYRERLNTPASPARRASSFPTLMVAFGGFALLVAALALFSLTIRSWRAEAREAPAREAIPAPAEAWAPTPVPSPAPLEAQTIPDAVAPEPEPAIAPSEKPAPVPPKPLEAPEISASQGTHPQEDGSGYPAAQYEHYSQPESNPTPSELPENPGGYTDRL